MEKKISTSKKQKDFPDKIKKGLNGQLWISKKIKNNQYRWFKLTCNTFKSNKKIYLKSSGRKIPPKPSKLCSNLSRKGLDNHFWKSRKINKNTNTYRWFTLKSTKKSTKKINKNLLKKLIKNLLKNLLKN